MDYLTKVRYFEKQAKFLRHLKQSLRVRLELKEVYKELHSLQSVYFVQPIEGFRSKTGRSNRKKEQFILGRTGYLNLIGIKPTRADYKPFYPKKRFNCVDRRK